MPVRRTRGLIRHGMSCWKVREALEAGMEFLANLPTKGTYMEMSTDEVESIQKAAPWDLELLEGHVYAEYVNLLLSFPQD